VIGRGVEGEVCGRAPRGSAGWLPPGMFIYRVLRLNLSTSEGGETYLLSQIPGSLETGVSWPAAKMVMHPRAGNGRARVRASRILDIHFSLFRTRLFPSAVITGRRRGRATSRRIEKSAVMSSNGKTEKRREKEREIGRRISRRTKRALDNARHSIRKIFFANYLPNR